MLLIGSWNIHAPIILPPSSEIIIRDGWRHGYYSNLFLPMQHYRFLNINSFIFPATPFIVCTSRKLYILIKQDYEYEYSMFSLTCRPSLSVSICVLIHWGLSFYLLLEIIPLSPSPPTSPLTTTHGHSQFTFDSFLYRKPSLRRIYQLAPKSAIDRSLGLSN